MSLSTEQAGTTQPFLHDLVTCVRAPGLVVSDKDGQVRPGGVQGVYRGDRRGVHTLLLTIDGREPEGVLATHQGVGEARFLAVVRGLGDPTPDPTVVLERLRSVGESGMEERVRLRSTAQVPVRTYVTLRVAADLAAMTVVKSGGSGEAVPAQAVDAGVRFPGQGTTVTAAAHPAPALQASDDGSCAVLEWPVVLPPRGEWEVVISIEIRETSPAAFEVVGAGDMPWQRPEVRADDRRLESLLHQSLDDLRGLLLVDPDSPADHYLAAGAPWFLTLFGRDSLWAARMLLPLGTDLARGTLRTLARRQGRRRDPASEEQPGKVLHEVRREELVLGELVLPPVYYGTVDATPLWVCLLADAWRWGMAEEDVVELLPACEAALGWLAGPGDSDGDGFLEYVDATGRGLSNQGWKDSGDSIQWADGRLADAPIALCEVQGYAHAAAVAGADLLEAFGRPGADRWREWAASLRARFRAHFWTEDELGPYPAVALDRDKRRVDSLTSNIGHLLGTGLLDAEEAAVVAARLAGADMDSGSGLRTLSARSPRFGPLSYHGGSVWPHDTAVVVSGLAAEGHHEVAGSLVRGLLAAAPGFGFRLPELFGGEQRVGDEPALPYPAACRPQAWAAAASVALLQAVVGVRPDVPAGPVSVRPLRGAPVGAVDVRGLVVGGQPLDVAVDREGRVKEVRAPEGVRLLEQ
ncbi:MAG: glycogen debranching N-terminal domain-containing protein [Motilibacteraceae bacterium]